MAKMRPGAELGHPTRARGSSARDARAENWSVTGLGGCGVPADVAPASPRPPQIAASATAPAANHSQVRERAALTGISFHLNRSVLTGAHGPAQDGFPRGLLASAVSRCSLDA